MIREYTSWLFPETMSMTQRATTYVLRELRERVRQKARYYNMKILAESKR